MRETARPPGQRAKPWLGDVSARKYIDSLSSALHQRNLKMVVRGSVVTVTNLAVRVDHSLGRAMNPGLSQDVLLRKTDDGLMWCWVWEPPRTGDRDAPIPDPEIEPFSMADDIERVAEKVARVVRTKPPGAGQ